jgi:chromosome segregation ATPase
MSSSASNSANTNNIGRNWLEGAREAISNSVANHLPVRPSTPLQRRPEAPRSAPSSPKSGAAPAFHRTNSNKELRPHAQTSTEQTRATMSMEPTTCTNTSSDNAEQTMNAHLRAQLASVEADYNQKLQASNQRNIKLERLVKACQQECQTLQAASQRAEAATRETKEELQKASEHAALERHLVADLVADLKQRLQSGDFFTNTTVSSEIQGKDVPVANLDRVKEQLLQELEAWEQQQQPAPVGNDDAENNNNRLIVEHKLRSELAKVKKLAEQQEQYRRDEANDLRLLNDAQDEEIEKLKQELAHTKQREQDLQRERDEFEAAAAKTQSRLDEVEEKVLELEEAKDQFNVNVEEAQQKQDTSHMLQVKLESVVQERDVLVQLCSDNEQHIARLESRVASMEAELAAVKNSDAGIERSLDKQVDLMGRVEQLQTSCESALLEKKQLQETHQAQVNSLEEQIKKLQQDLKDAAPIEYETFPKKGETKSDIISSPREPTKEELHKYLKGSQEMEERLSAELNARISEKQDELDDLQDKLEDRDATIADLVRSLELLEEQLALCRTEIDTLRNKLSVRVDTGTVDTFTQSRSTGASNDPKASLRPVRSLEKQLSQDNHLLKKEAQAANEEITRLRAQLATYKSKVLLLKSHNENKNDDDEDAKSETPSDAGSTTSSSFQMQLQERDNAIANLVEQSLAQDKLISDLNKALADLTVNAGARRSTSFDTTTGPTWEEVKELRKETEMFAGQVIEQDEEIEALTQQVDHLEATLKEINNNRSSPDKKIAELQAQVDEMDEANTVLRDEIRLLRRTQSAVEGSALETERLKIELHDSKKDAADFEHQLDVLSRQKAELNVELEALRSRVLSADEKLQENVRALEDALKERDDIIEELKQTAVAASAAATSTVDEMEVEALKSEITSLQNTLEHQTHELDKAKESIYEMEGMLADRQSHKAARLDEDKEDLINEVELLTTQLDEALLELKSLEEHRTIVNDFKSKLEESDVAHDESEKNIVDTYERRLKQLTLDKDVTIDSLRKELTTKKADYAQELKSLKSDLDQCQNELKNAREQMDAEIQSRDGKIIALQHTLNAQEDLVDSMKREMDHLQKNMDSISTSRRGEFEEMRQELTDITSIVAQQNNQIKSLQGTLQDKKVEYEIEMDKLKAEILSLENERDQNGPQHRDAFDLQMEIRLREVKERLEQLQFRNQALIGENTKLREKLAEAEVMQPGRSSDREKIAKLQQELGVQTAKVTTLEAQLSDMKIEQSIEVSVSPKSVSPKSVMDVKPPLPAQAATPKRLGFLGRIREKTATSEN